MNAQTPQEELRRRQRSLIPLNIVVVLLSLVAAFSILFMPLLTIRIDSAALESMQSQGGGEESTPEDGSPLAMLDGMTISASFDGMGLARLAFSDDPAAQLFGTVGEALSEQSNEFAARALVAMSSEAGVEVSESSVAAVTDSLRALEDAQGDEAVDTAIADLCDTLRSEFNADGAIDSWNDEELRKQIRDMYDTTAQHNDGVFTTEAFICVNVSAGAEGAEGEEDAPVYTNFSELVAGMTGGAEGDSSAAIPQGVLTGVGAAVLLFALVWILLAVFAFFRIFMRNKRFTMWYVKLLGFLPCLIFGIAPLVAGKLVPEAAAYLGMISTLAWISGACYLLLWLISVFWAFPIKRKIRKLQREIG